MRYLITNDEFQKRLELENPKVHTNTIFKNASTMLDCYCDYGHTWPASARNVLYNHTGCPYCSGLLPIVGENDLWTTHPEIAKLLKNPEDGYKVSYGSGKKLIWICPNCGEELEKMVSNVVNRGLSCNHCSDNFSFPNRFMANLLDELKLHYVPEYIINGKNFRYDFYIPGLSCIVEMHGRQHYESWSRSKKTLEEIQENDRQKYLYALENDITHYIIIDSKNSSSSYIKNNILNSTLSSLICLDNVNWNNVSYNSFRSLIHIAVNHYNNGKSPNEIAELLRKSPSTIYHWIHKGEELGLCTFIPSKSCINDERPVILINTKKIFTSMSEAARNTEQSVANISSVCNHSRKYCGLLNNKPMIWMFLDEYNGEEYEDFEVFISHKNGIRIHKYSLDGVYLEAFESITKAKEITGITTIINACNKRKYSAGGFRWYYADDKMQPDKTKIIGIPRYYGEYKNETTKAGK